jgi:hypothetical protein
VQANIQFEFISREKSSSSSTMSVLLNAKAKYGNNDVNNQRDATNSVY